MPYEGLPMIETQESICTWADETFGRPVSDASIAARALKEMAELVTACVYGEPAEKIGEEIADVVIVLARLGRSLDADAVVTISEAGHWSTRFDTMWHASGAVECIAGLLWTTGDARLVKLGRVLGALSAIASIHRVNLPAAIDTKMAINRARTWTIDGHGHGTHVRDANG